MKAVRDKRWANGYHFHPFYVSTTNLRFAYSRDPSDEGNRDSSTMKAAVEDGVRSSNGTAIGNPRLPEAIINGVLQGRKQDDPKGAATISRASMMALALKIRLGLQNRTATVPNQITTAPPRPNEMTVTKPRSLEALAAAVDVVTSKNGPADRGSVDEKAQHGNGGAVTKLFNGARTYYEAKRDSALEARRQVKTDVTAVALQNWIPNEIDDFPIDWAGQWGYGPD